MVDFFNKIFCCIKKWEKLSINLFYKRTITRQVKITEQKRWNENVWKKTTHPSAWLFLFCHRIDVKSSVNSIYLMFLRMWFGTLLSSVVECATLANCKRKKTSSGEICLWKKKLRNFIGWFFFFSGFWWLSQNNDTDDWFWGIGIFCCWADAAYLNIIVVWHMIV